MPAESLDEEGYVASAAPPFFQGDPDLAPPPQDEFPWLDFKQGTCDFCIKNDSRKVSLPWKPINSTSIDGVTVSMHSRQLEDKGGLCEFLIRGSLPMSRDAYFVLNADMEYRPQWDSSSTSITELSSSGPGAEVGMLAKRKRVLHWQVTYPWPLGRRDYLLEQAVHTEVDQAGGEIRCIQGCTLSEAASSSTRPPTRGVTRIEDYRACMAIWTGSDSGRKREAHFALLYFENSKVSLPGWLISRVAASTIPSSLAQAVPVAEKYPHQRFRTTLERYGINADAFVSSLQHRGPAASAQLPASDAAAHGSSPKENEESFYSASDEEEVSPLNVSGLARTSGVVARMAAVAAAGVASGGGAPSQSRSAAVRAVAAKASKVSPADHKRVQGMAHEKNPKTSPKSIVDQACVVDLAGEKLKTAQRPEKKVSLRASSLLRLSSKLDGTFAAKQLGGSSAGKQSKGSVQTPEKTSESAEELDLEEGLLVLSREDRDLLLEVLAETRAARQAGPSCWCPCRRRLCGHGRRHKL